jgi:hypothetical protein
MIPIILSVLLLGGIVYYGIRHMTFERGQKKKQEELADAYRCLLLRHRVAVAHDEFIGNRVLAFDRKNKKLIVVDHNEAAKQELCISLLSVSETKIVEEKNKDGFVERIFLQIKHKRSDARYRICFFDQLYDGIADLPGSARRAVMWKHRLDVHKYPGPVFWGQEYVL